jgi:hypothetical protein
MQTDIEERVPPSPGLVQSRQVSVPS